MGQNLSEPKTEKETVTYESGDYVIALSGMQGWRPDMEDAWSVQLPLSPVETGSAYFAVFDGHGSRHFSAYCAKHLHQIILDNQSFCNGEYEAGLKQSFHCLDLAMQQDDTSHLHKETGGTTAVVVLIKDGFILCANAGDSRAIASRNGKVIELSHDHKPTLPVELNRIYKAGGWVEFNRVNGNLALSRALGDFEFKRNEDLSPEEQMVTADPDITSFLLSPDHEFLVLACDGVWDVMTNEEVLDFVRKRIIRKMKPAQICESLLDHCLAPDCRMGGVGGDNMTVILTCFLHGGTYSQFTERCSQPPPGSPTSIHTVNPITTTSMATCTSNCRFNGGEFHNGDLLSPHKEEGGLVAANHPTDPLDLRRHDEGTKGVVSEMKCRYDSSDCNNSDCPHNNKEPHQLSCTV